MLDNDRQFTINPLYKFFDGLFGRNDEKFKKELIDNSYATSEEEFRVAQFNTATSYYGAANHDSNFINFDQVLRNKKQKIDKFREMMDFPEISDALDKVCDEAIVEDENGVIIRLNIKNEEELSESDIEKLLDVSNHISEHVIRVRDNLWRICRRYLVEGEVFLEKILANDKSKLIGVKLIPAYLIMPNYKSNIIENFLHVTIDKNGDQTLSDKGFDFNQISYVHWDDYINGDITNPKSYLYAAMRVFNILKMMEDSVAVYRVTRSSEHRVFNIEVGTMPPQKSQAYIEKLKLDLKKKNTWNPNDNTMGQIKNAMNVTEDFYFESRDGKGSKVEMLQSGMNIGKLEDVDYFLKKLYKSLKMPKSRWSDEPSMFGSGKNGQIEREEIDFTNFVKRIQNRLKRIFMDLFITELKLRGFKEEFLNPDNYDFQFSKSNFFAEYKNLEMLETKLAIVNMAFPLIYNPNTNPTGPLAMKYVIKEIFKMTDEEFKKNEEMLKEEKKENPPLNPFGGGMMPNLPNGGGGPKPFGADDEFEKPAPKPPIFPPKPAEKEDKEETE